jgi:hypothetical protein
MRPIVPAIAAPVPIMGMTDLAPYPRFAAYGAVVNGWREATEGMDR